MEALESQHFQLGLNSFSPGCDLHNRFGSEISLILLRQTEERARPIIQMLDSACDDPGNLLHSVEWFGLFDTNRVKMNLCKDFASLFIKVEQETIK